MLMPAQAVPALPTVRSSLGAIRKQAFKAGVGLRGMGDLGQNYSCDASGCIDIGGGGAEGVPIPVYTDTASAGGGAGSTIAPLVSAITTATAPILAAEATTIAHPPGTVSYGPGGYYSNLPGQAAPAVLGGFGSANAALSGITGLLPIIIIGVVAVSIFKSR